MKKCLLHFVILFFSSSVFCQDVLFGRDAASYFPEMIRNLQKAGIMARANADTIITYDTKHFRHFFHFKKQHSDIDVIVTESIDGVIDTELVMSQHGKIYTAQTAGLNFRIKTVDGGKAEWIKVSAKTGRNFIAFRWDVAKSTYSHYKCRGLSDREKQNSAASLKSTRRQAWQLKVVIP